MGGFLARRLAFAVVALFVGTSGIFLFFASKFWPLSHEPLLHAYWVWLRGLPSGHSISRGLVWPYPHLLPIVGAAFGRTVALLAVTLVIVLIVTVPLGCLAAAKRDSVLDVLLRGLSYFAWAVPGFLAATLLQGALGRVPGGWGLGWFPEIGWAGQCPNGQGIDQHTFQCPAAGHGIVHVGQVIYHLALPALALAFGFIGVQARYLRNSLLDALEEPYITVARGKGLSERAVLLNHGLRNALIAFVPAVVSDFGALFGAAFAVDYVFNIDGLGTLFVNLIKVNVDGLVNIDTYALVVTLLFSAVLMLFVSILGDVAVMMLDPRIRAD
jgi:peptide/nickel transport system permease protein